MTKRCWIISLVVAIIIGGLVYGYYHQPQPSSTFNGQYQLLTADQQVIGQIDILTTEQQHYQGFSYQQQPCPDCGLLFIWPTLSRPIMVMRHMNFALDFIWLRDQEIIQLTTNAPPEGANPQIQYQPNQPVNAVLEMPAGFIDRHNLQIGQSLHWQ